MSNAQDTLWEKFLQPIFGFLVDSQELQQLSEDIDWSGSSDRLEDPELVYPEYYRSQNFHGIEGGYLTKGAALSYDPVTKHALPPNEDWNRETIIKAVIGNPRKIIDLGCGTGSSTIMLKQAFPHADVMGLDLSPQMLAVSEYKAQQAQLDIQWIHGMAEATKLEEGTFDIVTASLLFHETPVSVAQEVLKEAHRLLKLGGKIIILDGHQKTLRNTTWLSDIFEEPYIKEYAAGSIDAWMGKAGFNRVLTEDVWWTNQLTTGVKSSSN